MKSIRLRRPPKPKYESLWDVMLILDLFSNWPINSQLNRKLLSFKLATLLCLVSCRRVSDVKALEISNRSYNMFGVNFELIRRTKIMSDSIFYPRFDFFPKLCVVDCMR